MRQRGSSLYRDLMSEIRHAQTNVAALHRWQRRTLIRKIVDQLHTMRDDELSDGAFDESHGLDKIIFSTCATISSLAESDDDYFRIVLQEFAELLKTMSNVIRRNAVSAELH
jgi:hypothetical protein